VAKYWLHFRVEHGRIIAGQINEQLPYQIVVFCCCFRFQNLKYSLYYLVNKLSEIRFPVIIRNATNITLLYCTMSDNCLALAVFDVEFGHVVEVAFDAVVT